MLVRSREIILIATVILASACDRKAPAPSGASPSTASSPASATPESTTPPFSVTAPAGFKIVQTTAKRMVLSTGSLPVQPSESYVIITRSSFVPGDEQHRRANAEQFASKVGEWELSGTPQTQKVSAGGLTGYECVRTGRNTKTGGSERVLVACLYQADGTITVLARCPDGEAAQHSLDAFREIVKSITPR